MNRFILCACLLLDCCLQPACTSTVTPHLVGSPAASFDGAVQNSGVVATAPGGYVVTPRFRARYNLALARYGSAWSPALVADYGLAQRADGDWFASAEAMEKFLVMVAWGRMGK